MERTDRVNRALADVLRGAYKQEGFTLPTLAAAAGIPNTTLQRIMAGNSPVTMGDLEAIAVAVNVPAPELFEAALKKADRDEMSAAASTPVSLDTKRKQNEARAMTIEQIETSKHAATQDPEYRADEPDPT